MEVLGFGQTLGHVRDEVQEQCVGSAHGDVLVLSDLDAIDVSEYVVVRKHVSRL